MKGRTGNDLAAILLAFSLNRKIFRLKRAEREILSSVQSLSCVQLCVKYWVGPKVRSANPVAVKKIGPFSQHTQMHPALLRRRGRPWY